MHISIVILNYNCFKETKSYISNLLTLNWNDFNFDIVVVDNGSSDESSKKLLNEYKFNNKVSVIVSDKNLGFAKGNNLGIKYAIDTFDSDLICVSNSDIEIRDIDFFQKVSTLYSNNLFDVLSPDIYSLSKNIHQSPIRQNPYTVAELETLIAKYKSNIKKVKFLSSLHLYNLLKKIRSVVGKKSRAISGFNYSCKQINIVPHGAFFILSKNYINAYPEGLFANTFLYLEEDALAIQCQKKNLSILYDPSLSVIHYDGVSTLKLNKNYAKKYIFEMNHTIDSAFMLIDYIKTIDKEL